MRSLLILAIVCAAPAWCAADQEKPESPVKVTKVTAPAKALKFEVMIPASVEEVWTAFTTNAGLATWLWKDVTVELRKEGEWTVHFPGGGTGGGTIVDFTPRQRLVMRALCPEQFPTVRRERTTAVFDFEPAGGKTRVTLTQTGWKPGKEWDDAYEYLASGNAQLLGQLLYRFTKGPIEWDTTAR
jgi:uncharacterized protein YndB with AHSA1/START domain